METPKIESETTPPQEPIFGELNLSEAEIWRGKEGDRDFIIEKIKELGIYSPNLIFRGFDGGLINIVKRKGVDIRDGSEFYASTEKELADTNNECAIDHALKHKVHGLAVYTKDKFEEDIIDYEYKLKPGASYKDALIAVFILKNR